MIIIKLLFLLIAYKFYILSLYACKKLMILLNMYLAKRVCGKHYMIHDCLLIYSRWFRFVLLNHNIIFVRDKRHVAKTLLYTFDYRGWRTLSLYVILSSISGKIHLRSVNPHDMSHVHTPHINFRRDVWVNDAILVTSFARGIQRDETRTLLRTVRAI